MKRNVMGFGIGMLGAALLLAGCGSDQKLEQTQQQLATATNELAVARTETSTVKTQMQARVDELQQTISKLTDDKADTEKKMASLKADMDNQLQQKQATVETLSQDITNLTSELRVLTDRIEDISQKYADLEKTHATTVTHLQAMRDEYVRLNNEKVALEAKLHDLKALKEQIVVVKQELHQKRVEELKRLDRAEYAMGNHGYFVKDGSIVVERTPGSYPLNQELYRPQ